MTAMVFGACISSRRVGGVKIGLVSGAQAGKDSTPMCATGVAASPSKPGNQGSIGLDKRD
jgi:hypothetical protein